ncbi:monocarboxylate transporter 12-like [Haliotis asinina]|uniref:monocarboxylate transporter 12-like n=1 Tax=Haliotis asinina TaxID=109174 RepID=UPI003531E215
MEVSRSNIDRGYAWVILAAAFTLQLMAGILVYSPGVMNIAVLEEIENDLTKTSWIGSANFGACTLLGPVAGLIQAKAGSRVAAMLGAALTLTGMTVASFCKTTFGLVLTYGLVSGFGVCLACNVVGVVTGKYFSKRHETAFGVCIAGGGLGLFVAGPLVRYLLSQYNLSGTLLILGAIEFHMCVAGVTLRPLRKEQAQGVTESRNDQREDTATDRGYIDRLLESNVCKVFMSFRVLKHIGFLIYNVSIMLWALGEAAAVFHLPYYAQQKGSSPDQAATLFTAMGVGSVFSRLAAGIMASDSKIPYLTLHTGFTGISGIVLLLFPLYSHTYTTQLVFGSLFGTYSQGMNTLVGPIVLTLVALEEIPVAYGFAFFFQGIGYILGPPAASWIYKLSGVYDFTYVFAGSSMVLSSMLAAAVGVVRRKDLQRMDALTPDVQQRDVKY